MGLAGGLQSTHLFGRIIAKITFPNCSRDRRPDANVLDRTGNIRLILEIWGCSGAYSVSATKHPPP